MCHTCEQYICNKTEFNFDFKGENHPKKACPNHGVEWGCENNNLCLFPIYRHCFFSEKSSRPMGLPPPCLRNRVEITSINSAPSLSSIKRWIWVCKGLTFTICLFWALLCHKGVIDYYYRLIFYLLENSKFFINQWYIIYSPINGIMYI